MGLINQTAQIKLAQMQPTLATAHTSDLTHEDTPPHHPAHVADAEAVGDLKQEAFCQIL
jgi:hypothetical protein